MGMRVPFGRPFQSADAKFRVAFSCLHMAWTGMDEAFVDFQISLTKKLNTTY